MTGLLECNGAEALVVTHTALIMLLRFEVIIRRFSIPAISDMWSVQASCFSVNDGCSSPGVYAGTFLCHC
jgi:hypothetical protein